MGNAAMSVKIHPIKAVLIIINIYKGMFLSFLCTFAPFFGA